MGDAMIRRLIGAIGLSVVATHALAAEPLEIGIGYLRHAGVKSTLSLVQQPADNDGVAGALLAIEDNNTTGKFLNQHFTLTEVRLKDGDDVAKAASSLAEHDGFIIADLPADEAVEGRRCAARPRHRAVRCRRDRRPAARAGLPRQCRSCRADPFDAGGRARRNIWSGSSGSAGCWWSARTTMTSSMPTRCAAPRRGSARRSCRSETFEDTGGARRTDSGVTLIQRQMPVFTQQAPAYDVLVAADESEVFASYLPYRTWDPRPVAGSAGLMPTSWDAAHDQWGAIQIQNRFLKLNSRHMTALDMQAWTAARMVGEAVSRTNASDPKTVFDFIKGKDFSVAAFKGQRLTLRDWNLQLRQPILLADGRMVVSVSPQEGFLHQVSELDTLGVDRPETKCKLQ